MIVPFKQSKCRSTIGLQPTKMFTSPPFSAPSTGFRSLPAQNINLIENGSHTVARDIFSLVYFIIKNNKRFGSPYTDEGWRAETFVILNDEINQRKHISCDCVRPIFYQVHVFKRITHQSLSERGGIKKFFKAVTSIHNLSIQHATWTQAGV